MAGLCGQEGQEVGEWSFLLSDTGRAAHELVRMAVQHDNLLGPASDCWQACGGPLLDSKLSRCCKPHCRCPGREDDWRQRDQAAQAG